MPSIWAVAVNTIKQVVRLKIAAIFIVLLIVLLPAMAMTMTGDGTIKGQLQTFVSYGLSLTSFLLCLLTIIASIYTLTSDLEQKQIYTVITKPIQRFQLICGKILGIMLLNVVLLCAFSSVIYGITIYMPKYLGADETEIDQLKNEFYTARIGIKPAEIDVSREVAKTYEKLKNAGQLPTDMTQDKIIADLTRWKKSNKRSAAVGQELIWEFYDIKVTDPNQSLFIRFKYDVSVNPPDMQIVGAWSIGDYRQMTAGNKIKTPYYIVERKDQIRTFQEIEVPANAVAGDGYLAVGFHNDPKFNKTVVIFPPEDGLKIFYKAGSFGANFIRAVLLILFRLIFLACLGTFTATFLSFPVAILFCFVIFFTGIISGFIIESFDSLSENISMLYYYSLRPLVLLLPRFDRFSPVKFLISAEFLSWFLLSSVFFTMVCIKSLLLLLLGVVVFSCKEIAKIVI